MISDFLLYIYLLGFTFVVLFTKRIERTKR